MSGSWAAARPFCAALLLRAPLHAASGLYYRGPFREFKAKVVSPPRGSGLEA